MPQKELPNVKHIERQCTYIATKPDKQCPARAFVQVIVVDDPALQKRIDERANKKLSDALELAHREGEHDD